MFPARMITIICQNELKDKKKKDLNDQSLCAYAWLEMIIF